MSSQVRAIIAIALIVVAISAGVATGTFATFTAQLTNPGNVAANAKITMTNVAGSAVTGNNCSTETASGVCATLFSVQNLLPGGSSSNTATINYTGTVPTGDFRLYMSSFNEFAPGFSVALCTNAHPGQQVGLQVKQGTAIIYPTSGTGFGSLFGFNGSYSSSTNGLQLKPSANGDTGSMGVWPAGNSPVTFTINVQLDPSVDNTNQGCRSTFDLNWYATQNTPGTPPPPPDGTPNFGPATSIACTANPSTVTGNGIATTTVSGTLKDANGATVNAGASMVITFNNNTPALLTPTGQMAVGTVTGTASVTYFTNIGASGGAQISLTSGTLTGCSALITVDPIGPASKTITTFSPLTIAADGVSRSRLRIDVTDANGNRVTTDQVTQITAAQATGAASCTPTTFGPQTVASGRVNFYVTSTTTPGTCSYNVSTNNAALAGSSATLTAVVVGAPNSLAATTSQSPASVGCDPQPFGLFNCPFTVVTLQDANGNRETGPAGQNVPITAVWTISSTPGNGCPAGLQPLNGSTNAIVAVTTVGNTANAVISTGTSATTAGRATFSWGSNASTNGCTISLTDGTGVGITTTTIAFNPGAPTTLACGFSPNPIAADGASTSVSTVRIVDNFGNGTNPTFPYSVGFARTSSTAVGGQATTLLTAPSQFTTNGIATFTVRSLVTNGTDTYTATAQVQGNTPQTATCNITTQ